MCKPCRWCQGMSEKQRQKGEVKEERNPKSSIWVDVEQRCYEWKPALQGECLWREARAIQYYITDCGLFGLKK